MSFYLFGQQREYKSLYARLRELFAANAAVLLCAYIIIKDDKDFLNVNMEYSKRMTALRSIENE